MKRIFAALVLCLSLTGISAYAADKDDGPCKADKEKFCAGMSAGKGLGKCMQEHLSDLSPACHEKLETRMKSHPCWDDHEKFCKGTAWGKGLGKCLHEHHDQLSDKCKAAMQKRHDKKEDSAEKKS